MANFNALATAGRQLEEAVRVQRMMEEEGASTDEHMKAMWEGQSNILVCVRVRPLMKHDVIKKSCVRILDGKVIAIADPAMGDKQDVLRANRNREKQYAFDFVFEPASSQEAVFLHTTKFLIHGVLDGYNATVFAYGQTGSGKTHTMIGSPSDPGIMVRVMDHLFAYSATFGEQQRVDFKVTVSFLEVYNENIRDLLSEAEEYLDLREDPIKGPMVAGITEVETGSSEEIMRLLHQGNARRSQAATAANEVSSRSHAVLQVLVENKDKASGVVANIKVGKLSLVDLAGSERAANTKNTGARLVEGANINRSLLALGNCINALGEKGNKGNFVPYRDSKLTRLLKDSLGGNCRTVMIANISASESSFEETSNTLKYANRAKNIKTNVQRNVLNVNYHISEYVQLIDNLRNEIKVLKDQLGSQPAIPGHADPARALLEGGAVASMLGQPSPAVRHVDTPLLALRESMKSAASMGEGRELLNKMRQQIVENFQEKMQLRRSLIELEDQNVQNSIEVSKRQLRVVQWCEVQGGAFKTRDIGAGGADADPDMTVELITKAPPDIKEAWQEVEQLRKAILKNNAMKRNISKRLRHNEREAEKFRENMSTNVVTSEDRRELMELQYQVGRLELENMELEQHRIVHDSVLKGKDLTIQKLMLQLAVRDKIIQRQQSILRQNDLDHKVGYAQLALLESTLISTDAPLSPPRPINNNIYGGNNSSGGNYSGSNNNSHVVDSDGEIEDFEGSSSGRRGRSNNEDSYYSDDGSVDSPRPGPKKGGNQRAGGGSNQAFNNNNPLLPGFMKEQIQGLRAQGVRASRQLRVPNGPGGNAQMGGNNLVGNNSLDDFMITPSNNNANNAPSNNNSNDKVPLRPQIQPIAKKSAEMLQQNINILNGNRPEDSDGEGIGVLRGNAYAKPAANGGFANGGGNNANNNKRLGPIGQNPAKDLTPLGLEDVEETPIGVGAAVGKSVQPVTGTAIRANGNASGANNGGVNNNNNNNNNNKAYNIGNAMLKNQGRSNAQNNSRENYSDDDFLEESGESDSDSDRKGKNYNMAKVAPLATINEENNAGARGAAGKNLGKLKVKPGNGEQGGAPLADPVSLYLEGNNNAMVSNENKKVKAIKPKVITKSGANSASEIGLNAISNMNNGPSGGPNLVVPQIGGRNRSLPNLSKQNSGPNSSRSQGDRK